MYDDCDINDHDRIGCDSEHVDDSEEENEYVPKRQKRPLRKFKEGEIDPNAEDDHEGPCVHGHIAEA